MKWLAPLQVPSVWRPVTEDPATLQLFLDYYAASTPPLSKHALECLVRCQSQIYPGQQSKSAVLASRLPKQQSERKGRAPQHGARLLSSPLASVQPAAVQRLMPGSGGRCGSRL